MDQEEKKEFTNDELLSALFNYAGNIELYEMISTYSDDHLLKNPLKIKLKEGVSQSDITNAVAVDFLDEVFTILQLVFLFHDKQFQVVEYIKGFFRRWEISLSELFRKLILNGLGDERRFGFRSGGMIFIKNSIEKMNIGEIHSNENIKIQTNWIGYFSDNAGIEYGKFVRGYLTVRALLQTETDIVRGFIKEHTTEVIKEVNEIFGKKLIAEMADPEEEKLIAEIRNWNVQTRYYLLEKTGLMESTFYKSIRNQKEKHSFIANLLKCSPRHAKKVVNGELLASTAEKKEVDLYLNGLK